MLFDRMDSAFCNKSYCKIQTDFSVVILLHTLDFDYLHKCILNKLIEVYQAIKQKMKPTK